LALKTSKTALKTSNFGIKSLQPALNPSKLALFDFNSEIGSIYVIPLKYLPYQLL